MEITLGITTEVSFCCLEALFAYEIIMLHLGIVTNSAIINPLQMIMLYYKFEFQPKICYDARIL